MRSSLGLPPAQGMFDCVRDRLNRLAPKIFACTQSTEPVGRSDLSLIVARSAAFLVNVAERQLLASGWSRSTADLNGIRIWDQFVRSSLYVCNFAWQNEYPLARLLTSPMAPPNLELESNVICATISNFAVRGGGGRYTYFTNTCGRVTGKGAILGKKKGRLSFASPYVRRTLRGVCGGT
jgi:hypothetical protein